MQNKITILWADDEIDMLKPHIMFLEEKGYVVEAVNSGDVALETIKNKIIDIVFIDENMPGLSGIETLTKIKELRSEVPVVMITKSEEENLMEDAIGSKIADYLIKPVKPNQLLLSLKKILDNQKIIEKKVTTSYQQEYRTISMNLSDKLSFNEWCEVYKKLVYWELELDASNDKSMMEILKMQKTEANKLFSKYIEKSYTTWFSLKNESDIPLLSHTLLKKQFLPLAEKEKSTFLLVIDNLRYDQWKIIQPVINSYYRTDEEQMYCSILPTATQYARNSLFAGLMPSEIEKIYPNLWLNDEDEGGKNMHEEELFLHQLKRISKTVPCSYTKITTLAAGKKMAENITNLLTNKINIVVYNFVDMLSHARTEMEIIRELADDEKAYRSITLSWFENSPLLEIIKQLAEKKVKLFITTDHGTIKVTEPTKIIGDKNVNTNLRYKQGKSLTYDKKDVFEVKNPNDVYLPKQHVSSTFVFAKEDMFFAYPNNYNHYVNYYRNTFQHGGVSMEEMLIPYVILSPK